MNQKITLKVKAKTQAKLTGDKYEVSDFIAKILEDAECEKVRINKDDVTAQCPFHRPRRNRNAFGVSFILEDKLYPFHCFSCGEGGSIIRLISHIYQCSFDKAISIFKKKVAIRPVTLGSIQEEFEKFKSIRASVKIDKPVELPIKCQNQKPMYKYMKWRNKIRQHKVMDINWLVNKYELYYTTEEFYMGRIIMPIRDALGNIVAFNNRSVYDDAELKTKYTPGVDITSYLHGLYQAMGKKYVIVVEGSFDMFQVACALKHHDMTDYGVVSVMGVIMNEHRANLIASLFEKAVILLDNDETGFRESWKITRFLRDYMPVENKTMLIPRTKDPAICSEEQLIEAITTKVKSNLEEKSFEEFLSSKY